jgi:hypothetical protein
VANRGKKFKGVAAVSIVIVSIAMGTKSIRLVGPDVATAARADSCDDFALAIFLKGQGLLHKADPFLRSTAERNGFQKVGPNVVGFYQLSNGAAEVFLKDDIQGGDAGIAVCTEDATGVTRYFFETDDTVDGSHTSFSTVDDQQASLVITTDNTIITTTFKASPQDIPIVKTVDKSNP